MGDLNIFDPSYKVEGITPENYSTAQNYIKCLDKVSSVAYESIYVLDFFQQRFLFVSNNRLFLCGLSSEDVKRMGDAFFIQHIPMEDLSVLNETKNLFFRFLHDLPREEKPYFSASCNFHIMHKDSLRMVHHKISPLESIVR